MRALILALTLILMTGAGMGKSMADDTDNSDWFSKLGHECSTPRSEILGGANFIIAGVDLRLDQPIRDAMEKIARPPVIISRGDASTGRTQICFKSPSDNGRVKLFFEKTELASVAFLFDGGPDWSGSDKCLASRKISGNLATGSGLHLGMTAAEVETILGRPCVESSDGLEYQFRSRRFPTAKERERIKEGLDDNDPNAYFDVIATVQIRFREAKASYIAILTQESQ